MVCALRAGPEEIEAAAWVESTGFYRIEALAKMASSWIVALVCRNCSRPVIDRGEIELVTKTVAGGAQSSSTTSGPAEEIGCGDAFRSAMRRSVGKRRRDEPELRRAENCCWGAHHVSFGPVSRAPQGSGGRQLPRLAPKAAPEAARTGEQISKGNSAAGAGRGRAARALPRDGYKGDVGEQQWARFQRVSSLPGCGD